MAQNCLVWIDLEMTGLNPDHDSILEIATIITDNDLEIIAQGPALVIHQPDSLLSTMDEWNVTHHTASGLVKSVRESVISLAEAEAQTLSFISQYCKAQKAPLCGNSVWVDRIFLRAWMPTLESYLNYRIIDVSSIKEAIRRWYPKRPETRFVKPEGHRALEDITYSIQELKHYKTNFFVEIK